MTFLICRVNLLSLLFVKQKRFNVGKKLASLVFMATPAELLDNMVPVSAFSRGKAAQAFSSASNSTPVIVLKNNAPYRVITTPDEYAYLSEVEADMVLMAEAMARLTANQDAGSVPAEEVYAELGIALEDVDAIEDVELA